MQMHGPKSTEYRHNWRTPPELFRWLDCRYGHFDVDLAADDDNHLLPQYFTAQRSALQIPNHWPERCFCNPPYGDLEPWVRRFVVHARSGGRVCAILPSNTSSAWFVPVFDNAKIVWITGRVQFVHPITGRPTHGNNSGTVIALFGYGNVMSDPNEHYRWLDIRAGKV